MGIKIMKIQVFCRAQVRCLGKDRQLRGGEKGGREKARPSKKKDREMKRKQAKRDRLQRQRDRT